jgi:hypothetical protein
MNTNAHEPRLLRLNPEWSAEFHAYLKNDADILAAIPNDDGRSFSVWPAEHLIPDPALRMLSTFGFGLRFLRNFKLDANNRNATMLHRDHPSSPCFAVNMCIRGKMRVHFYQDKPLLAKEGSDTEFCSSNEPNASYDVDEGELFIMDTSTIHQADTSNCNQPVLLASFIPKPQYRYEDALGILNNGQRSLLATSDERTSKLPHDRLASWKHLSV